MNDMIEYPREGILSKQVFQEGEMDVSLFCMAAGSRISEHTSGKEAVVHVLEGKGTFTLKGEDIPMLRGTLIHMMPGDPHWLDAEDNTSFLLILR